MRVRLGLFIGRLIALLLWPVRGYLLRRYGPRILAAALETAENDPGNVGLEYFVKKASTDTGRENITELGWAHQFKRLEEIREGTKRG